MIELRDICKTYQVGDVDLAVLKGISATISDGEYVALMGASGSGKTTLMNLLGSLDQPSDGRYRLAGIDVSELSSEELSSFRGTHIGFVFQNFNLLPRTSALDNVLLPTLYATDGRSRRERVDYAKQLLSAVGLGDRMDHTPNQLSGGERQRVAIARSLINRPALLLADEPTGNLDSNTEQEILGVFRRLNREHRITLVVVTHDQAVADQADRVIHMKDGVIVDDVARSQSPEDAFHSLRQNSEPPAPLATAQPLAIGAVLNAVMVAVMALRRNALRTVLTMLGVIIGVSSVVSVMELNSGASAAIEDTVASMGASMLTISPGKGSSKGGRRKRIQITPDDVEAVANGCPAVQVAAPLVYSGVQVVRGNRRWKPNFAMGTSAEYLVARNWDELDMGQTLSPQHIYDAAKVCILGKTVANELFDDKYPVGQEVRVNGVPMRVIGVLAPKGGDIVGNDQDDIIVAPWTTFKYRINSSVSAPPRVTTFGDNLPPMQLANQRRQVRNESVHQIYVQARSPAHVAAAREQITNLLSRRHDVESQGAYTINDITEVSKVVGQVVSGLSALGLVISGVSLMVGGVGIMNIMLVSVTERTREIGLRMAVGANRRAILRQFLIEATVLCLFGGLIGIVVGHVYASLIGFVIGWPTQMSFSAAVVAVVVAATVGIVFGFYPARTASRLNPIDALRFE